VTTTIASPATTDGKGRYRPRLRKSHRRWRYLTMICQISKLAAIEGGREAGLRIGQLLLTSLSAFP
jgi:hypothetical protein